MKYKSRVEEYTGGTGQDGKIEYIERVPNTYEKIKSSYHWKIFTLKMKFIFGFPKFFIRRALIKAYREQLKKYIKALKEVK